MKYFICAVTGALACAFGLIFPILGIYDGLYGVVTGLCLFILPVVGMNIYDAYSSLKETCTTASGMFRYIMAKLKWKYKVRKEKHASND